MKYQEFLYYIKNNIKIADIVGSYTQLQPKGGRLWGRSPFNEERTPSFTVDEYNNTFYCFSTNQGGDVISFLMKRENLNFKDAINFLSEKYNFEVEWSSFEIDNQNVSQNKKTIKQLYNQVNNYFAKSFQINEKAKNYIESRGIKQENAKKFKLGYCPPYDNLYLYLRNLNYDDEILSNSMLFSKNNTMFTIFGDRLMFPIEDRAGNIVAFGGRTLDKDNNIKYINSPDSEIYKKGSILYGFNLAKEEIRDKDLVYIVEGYLDVISFHQAGIYNVVAPLGTAFTERQIDILKSYTRNFVFAFDGDRAGLNATIKYIKLTLSKKIICYVVKFPNSLDPNDIINSNDYNLKDILEKKEHYFDFLIKEFKLLPSNDLIQKSIGLDNIFEFLLYEKKSTIKDRLFTSIASSLNFAYEDVVSDFNDYIKENSSEYNKIYKNHIPYNPLLFTEEGFNKTKDEKEILCYRVFEIYLNRIQKSLQNQLFTEISKKLFIDLETVEKYCYKFLKDKSNNSNNNIKKNDKILDDMSFTFQNLKHLLYYENELLKRFIMYFENIDSLINIMGVNNFDFSNISDLTKEFIQKVIDLYQINKSATFKDIYDIVGVYVLSSQEFEILENNSKDKDLAYKCNDFLNIIGNLEYFFLSQDIYQKKLNKHYLNLSDLDIDYCNLLDKRRITIN